MSKGDNHVKRYLHIQLALGRTMGFIILMLDAFYYQKVIVQERGKFKAELRRPRIPKAKSIRILWVVDECPITRVIVSHFWLD